MPSYWLAGMRQLYVLAHTWLEKLKLQNANHICVFQSGFRCRDHSTSSERMQSLQKRHEKPLATSQGSRAEPSPEPLYFEVLVCETLSQSSNASRVWSKWCSQWEVTKYLAPRCTVKVTNLLDDPCIVYTKRLVFRCCGKGSNLEHCGWQIK